jgi:putative membrane protein
MQWTERFLGLAGCLLLALALHGAEDRKLIAKIPAGEAASDQEFVVWALACEIAEIKFAERALKQTGNEDVKKFARMIAQHHTKTRDALLVKAKEMKVAVVEGLEKHHREAYERLGKLEGSEFDREYTRYLIEGHEKGVKMYEKWAKDARDAGLRDLAARTLLAVKDHLEQARKLSGGIKP